MKKPKDGVSRSEQGADDAPKDYAAVTAALKRGAKLKYALMEGGYSESSANKGMATVMKSEPLQKAMLAVGVDYAKIGEKLDPTHITAAITGKLYTGMLTGDESGINATKMLGQLRTVGAFQNENLIQAVIIQAPERASAASLQPEPENKLLEE